MASKTLFDIILEAQEFRLTEEAETETKNPVKDKLLIYANLIQTHVKEIISMANNEEDVINWDSINFTLDLIAKTTNEIKSLNSSTEVSTEAPEFTNIATVIEGEL